MEYISKKEFSQLKGKDVTITKVYGPYRKGFNKPLNRYETFKNGSEKMSVRENGEEVEVEGKVDYKIHKKKYDIVVALAKPLKITINKYNKEIQDNEEVDVKDEEYTVKEISATMLGDMMACGVAFGKVPVDDQERRVFDWEEQFIAELEGTAVKFATEKKDWEIDGKSGTYDALTFKEGTATEAKPQKQDEDEEEMPDDEMPF